MNGRLCLCCVRIFLKNHNLMERWSTPTLLRLHPLSHLPAAVGIKTKSYPQLQSEKKSFVPRDDSSFFPFRMIIMISFSLIDQVAFFLFFPHFSRSPNANSGTRVTNFPLIRSFFFVSYFEIFFILSCGTNVSLDFFSRNIAGVSTGRRGMCVRSDWPFLSRPF